VHVLAELARQPLAGCKVVMVTPFARQMYSGMVPGLVAGHYRTKQCAIALPPLAQAAGVQLLEGAAAGLDTTAREVVLANGQRLPYDWLSLDTGAVMDRSRLPGAREHALFVRPMEHFVRLLKDLVELAQQRTLDIVLVGGGAAGVELAMALQYRLRTPARGASSQARVALVTGGGEPMQGYPPAVVALAAAELRRHRITVFRDVAAQLTAGHMQLRSGARLSCDAAVLATGAEAPAWLRGSGLALDERGFVCTGATLQSTSHPQVFAVGDVASRVDTQHPKSGVYAVRAGPPLMANLRLALAGQPPRLYQPQTRTLNLISCGDRRAIVSWGRFSAHGRWAWWWKDQIDRSFVARYGAPANQADAHGDLSRPA
jgi:pyridine nucleotide-disulfide oxidoreductase family protein